MTDPTTDLTGLIEFVNARHGTAFRPHGAYLRGENRGAYAIVGPEGERLVLKHTLAEPAKVRGIERAKAITARLHDLGATVPRYILSGTTPDGTLYYLQEALPGEPVGRLTQPVLLDRLIALNDLQAEQAISAEQNWSSYVADVVFRGGSGWADELRAYSATTAELVDALARLTAGREDCALKRADIVHGDLSPGNILVNDGQISGIVDWDAAGCGDRAFDLALLLFYHYDEPRIRTPLRDRVVALSGVNALCIYLTYTILSQMTWSSRHHGQSAVEHWLSRAGRIFHDLRSLA